MLFVYTTRSCVWKAREKKVLVRSGGESFAVVCLSHLAGVMCYACSSAWKLLDCMFAQTCKPPCLQQSLGARCKVFVELSVLCEMMNVDPLTIMRLCLTAQAPPCSSFTLPPPLPPPMPTPSSPPPMPGLTEALLQQLLNQRGNAPMVPPKMSLTAFPPMPPELTSCQASPLDNKQATEAEVKKGKNEEEEMTTVKAKPKVAQGSVRKYLSEPEKEEEPTPVVMKPKPKCRPIMRLIQSIRVDQGYLDIYSRFRACDEGDVGGSSPRASGAEMADPNLAPGSLLLEETKTDASPLPIPPPPTEPHPDVSKKENKGKLEG